MSKHALEYREKVIRRWGLLRRVSFVPCDEQDDRKFSLEVRDPSGEPFEIALALTELINRLAYEMEVKDSRHLHRTRQFQEEREESSG